MTNRYSRQIAFAPIGADGQKRISKASVMVIGCGALGSSSAEMLVRAGIGSLTLLDRDLVELSNIQRQCLFTEKDALQGNPKAIACRQALQRINSEIKIPAHVAELTSQNISSKIGEPDLILDATDNFSTRYLINDYAIKHSLSWIFASCLGSRGTVVTFQANSGYCLRCILGPKPPSGTIETCLTEGILGPTARFSSSIQVSQALGLLVNKKNGNRLFSFDLWSDFFSTAPISTDRAVPCPTCQNHNFEFLEQKLEHCVRRLCGEQSIQICPFEDTFDYESVRQRLLKYGLLIDTDYMLRLSVENCEISLFRDGRSIIRGASSTGRAQSLYTNYIGH